jgi:drug/metabolite transporter (DMT)-like permease
VTFYKLQSLRHHLLSIIYGILSAASWGAADFVGGLATKRTSPYRVLFLSEIAGLIPFTALALLGREPLPSTADLLLGAGSSLLGLTGLLFLYRALADGKMTIAAPVSALFAALIPVVFGFFTRGVPSPITLTGFAFAFLAVWFISQPDGTDLSSPTRGLPRFADTSTSLTVRAANTGGTAVRDGSASLRLPLLAGIFFGLYFIVIYRATVHSFFWPLAAARLAGIVAFGLYALLMRQPAMPPRDVWGFCVLNGVIDIGGNAFYVLASHIGRIDVAAVLGALYPASTVLLAWIVLKEKINWVQALGVLLAFGAIILFTL